MKYPLINHRITSEYGWRNIGGKLDWHGGVDYGAVNPGVEGDNVYSIANNSKVKFVGYDKYRGHNIVLEHSSHCTRYNHLKEVFVKENEIVGEDDCIGLMGSTGSSTAAHLHFEVHKCLYDQFNERWSNGEAKHTVDPEKFFMEYMKPKHLLIKELDEVINNFR